VLDCESEEAAEIQGKGIFQVQQVRAPARVYAKVRRLPHLFPRARARGEDPGRYEGELVDFRRMAIHEGEFEVMAK
jgi:hypothetical protein